jgi:hypothetical protein
MPDAVGFFSSVGRFPEYQVDGGFWNNLTVQDEYRVMEINDDRHSGRFLVGGTTQDPWELRSYSPLDVTNLWIEFANLEPDEKQIISFASKYGRLGGALECDLNGYVPVGFYAEKMLSSEALSDSHPGYWYSNFYGERITDWIHEIKSIKPLFEFWSLLNSGEYTILEEKVQILAKKILFKGDFLAIEDCSRPDFTKPRYLRYPRITERFFDSEEIDNFEFHSSRDDLRHIVSAFLFKQVSGFLNGLVTARLRWDAKSHRSEIVFAPSDIIGLIWFQFAQALEGKSEFKRCEVCKEWFAIRSSEGKQRKGRTDQIICGGACRVKKYEATEKGKKIIAERKAAKLEARKKAKLENPVTNP